MYAVETLAEGDLFKFVYDQKRLVIQLRHVQLQIIKLGAKSVKRVSTHPALRVSNFRLRGRGDESPRPFAGW